MRIPIICGSESLDGVVDAPFREMTGIHIENLVIQPPQISSIQRLYIRKMPIFDIRNGYEIVGPWSREDQPPYLKEFPMYGFTSITSSTKIGLLVASVRSLLSCCPHSCYFRRTGTCYASCGRYRMLDRYCTASLSDLLAWLKDLKNPFLRLWTAGDFPQDLGEASSIIRNIPRTAITWAYSHRGERFTNYLNGLRRNVCVNRSTERISTAVNACRHGKPTVLTVTPSFWNGHRYRRIDDVTIVKCPAEYRPSLQCSTCGNGLPLCARKERSYVVGFTLHGTRIKESDLAHLEYENWTPADYRPLQMATC